MLDLGSNPAGRSRLGQGCGALLFGQFWGCHTPPVSGVAHSTNPKRRSIDAGHPGQDGASSSNRIGSAQDGSTDHQIVGSPPDCFRGVGRASLIVRLGTNRPDPRCHSDQIGCDLSNHPEFVW